VEVRGRERREDRERGHGVGLTARDVMRPLVRVDRGLVDDVDEQRAEERADHLRRDVSGHLAPREPAAQRERDGDRRVDVGAADPPGHVDGERDGEAPAPGDDQPVAAGGEDLRATAGLVERGDSHRHDAVTEADEHERADELRDQLAGRRAPQARAARLRRGRRRGVRHVTRPAGRGRRRIAQRRRTPTGRRRSRPRARGGSPRPRARRCRR
jgi:hypothetical protein